MVVTLQSLLCNKGFKKACALIRRKNVSPEPFFILTIRFLSNILLVPSPFQGQSVCVARLRTQAVSRLTKTQRKSVVSAISFLSIHPLKGEGLVRGRYPLLRKREGRVVVINQ